MANPRVDPSQEVVDASWEPSEMPPLGGAVHFYTYEKRMQWGSIGTGPYAALVTNHRGGGRLTLFVLPSVPVQLPQVIEDVPSVRDETSLYWWQPIPGLGSTLRTNA
jgi:hypothetical protein